jgi:hypothetical protein
MQANKKEEQAACEKPKASQKVLNACNDSLLIKALKLSGTFLFHLL